VFAFRELGSIRGLATRAIKLEPYLVAARSRGQVDNIALTWLRASVRTHTISSRSHLKVSARCSVIKVDPTSHQRDIFPD
jgi:hypothetical protein